MEHPIKRDNKQPARPALALRPSRASHPHPAAPSSRVLLTELLNIGLALVVVLLLTAIIRIFLEDYGPWSRPVTAAYNGHEAVTLTALASLPTETHTPAPTATATSTSTPLPTNTRLPTHTPRPTATPTLTPTLTPMSPLGRYPPTVTPNYTNVLSGTPVPDPAPLVYFPQGTINIALLGSDKRPNSTGWRTDTVIVASVNPNVPSVAMLSIPRDLYLYIPGWTFQRINLADSHGAGSGFPGGGPGLIKQTIQYNLGVHVDYYARVDFAGFMKIIDTLGGVDVVADCPLYDVFPDDPITEDPTVTNTISIPAPGVYHLDGKHALWYARSRYTSVGGDLDRVRRQHRVLRGIWNKAKEVNVLGRLPELWSQMSSSIETDLGWNEIVWLASLGPQLDNSHIRSGFIDGAALQPWTTPSGASVFLPNTEPMLAQVRAVFNPPSNIAMQAPARVEVWNGTRNKDWDILATDRLQWAGYLVTAFRTAERQDYARTQIVDFTTTSKGSRLPALMRLFNVDPADVISQPDPSSPVPYRVIVGANYTPCQRAAPVHRPTPTPTSSPTPEP